MKKRKFSLGEGGIKGFLSRNVEKIVFGIAVLLVIWVALPDSKRTPIDEDQLGPESIVNRVNSTKNRLASTTAWELIKSERFRTPDNYVPRAEESLIRVNRDGYSADVPFDKPLFPPDLRRDDPDIYPIENIEVAVSYGPVTVAEAGGRTPRPTRITPRTSTTDDSTRPLPPKTQERLRRYGVAASGGKAQGDKRLSILGQVPIKRQIGEYRATFKDAADYMPNRDIPTYGAGRDKDYYYKVERAEIAPDGKTGAWKVIGDSTRARKAEASWSQVQELVDARYVDPKWTMALPPLMLRDLRPLALHSEVPSAQSTIDAATPEEEAEEDPLEELDGPIIGGNETPAGSRPTRGPQPRNPRGGEGFGGRFNAGGAVAGADDVEYKLFRYFDMDVQPGKAYVYRVKLYIEDPNDPATPSPKPPLRVLSKSVIDRLARKTDKNVWWRESDYSEVSAVVRVPATNQVLAGAVNPGKVIQPAGVPVGIRQSEETAKMKVLAWDERKAMDVPGDIEVSRGSVLNFTADVEAIDVAAGMLKKLPAYTFETNSVVLDLRGGESFGKKTDLSTPGEMLIIDGNGNLMVRSELDDRVAYDENTFPETPKGSSAGEGMFDDGDKKPRPSTRPPRGREGEVNLIDGGSSPPRRPRPN